MKREIVLAAITFAVAASGGFLLGRKFPAHHYAPWKNSNLLLDETTGAVCNPLRPFETTTSADAFDRAAAELKRSADPNRDVPACN
jgi:hypothetical protein